MAGPCQKDEGKLKSGKNWKEAEPVGSTRPPCLFFFFVFFFYWTEERISKLKTEKLKAGSSEGERPHRTPYRRPT